MKALKGALPLYYQIKQSLLRRIEDGEFQPGDSLPPERELAQHYRASRITIRRALSELVREGKVRQEQGRGTFVAPPKIRRGLNQVTSFTQEMVARGVKPGAVLLDCRREAPPRVIARELHLAEGETVLVVERVRLADGEPIAFSQSYLALPTFIHLRREDLAAGNSLWALLDAQGLRIAEAEKQVEATLADERTAAILHVPVGSLFLQVDTTAFVEDGTPIEFNRVVFRSDRYRLSFHQTR